MHMGLAVFLGSSISMGLSPDSIPSLTLLFCNSFQRLIVRITCGILFSQEKLEHPHGQLDLTLYNAILQWLAMKSSNAS